ncbi:hypothetical protein [Anaplasma capra]|uniref:hypothetical protein n=1 Tax=Anaplasma capra TaxID=1562740 RepID=UPI0021D5CA2B|nr:hypothetical protein [Anaplasma capra]MCU7611562.1 hypothetical protein [Anaplasma capra]MCU7611999.1 hypothetical protein [Anaplasma capra]
MLRSRKVASQCLSAACVAATISVFCSKYFDVYEDGEVLNECKRLKSELENLAIKQSIMKSRVSDHFSLFCVLGSIDTEIPEGWFPPVNHTTCIALDKTVRTVCKVVLGAVIGSVILLYVFKQRLGIGLHKEGGGVLSDFAIAFIVSSFVILGVLGFCSSARQQDFQRKQSRELKKLADMHARSQTDCEKIVCSAERYNSLPEEVKCSIRSSEYLSALVKEKIVSGVFTDKSAEDIRKKVVGKCCEEEAAICA